MSRRTMLWGGRGSGGISIKDEIGNTLHGKGSDPGQGQPAIFRRVRRGSNAKPVLCPECRKIGVQSSRREVDCGRCMGVGYLWDEDWIMVYTWPGTSVSRSRSGYKKYAEPGIIETDIAVWYLEAHICPTLEDKIITVRLDEDGNVVTPYERLYMYDFRTVDEHRLDDGKLEYWRITANKITMGRFGQPIATASPSDRRMP